ncbi:hypothetical protein RJ640_011344 [Escallonia rubra]|uniref:DDE Tnp4 domain-containing protein n=1 Tax=Escallonia rubra TaxID=112253 RepID=A0AA88QJC0_9ASTE|nr:hypothetical protein RJ640_011344 [Escallonia rubra]
MVRQECETRLRRYRDAIGGCHDDSRRCMAAEMWIDNETRDLLERWMKMCQGFSCTMESSDDENNGALENYVAKERRHTFPSNGVKFVDDVLNGKSGSCLENFRMDKHVFYKLCDILQARGLLRHTNRIKIEEQLAIFMFIIGHNLRTRAVQELFKYSGETISRHFNNVLNAIMAISLDFFQPPGSDIPPEIQEDQRFYPYFRDCVGAVDGIHFPVMVGVDEQGPFRNKNGLLSQNVLVACSFDMKFHYVLAGWEGSATDLRVLCSALIRRSKLHVPEGKYYLVDNEYANIPGFIAPYSDVPYDSLNSGGGFHPQDAKELFNHRHSMLHNATHRTFAALKARFPILTSAPPYPMPTQVKLVVAACALHNYIRGETPDDWIFRMYEQETELPLENSMPPSETEALFKSAEEQTIDIPFQTEELEHTSQLRDSIATAIWNDYIRDFAV